MNYKTLLDSIMTMAPPPQNGGETGPGGLLAILPPMIMMFLIFYFVLIRPQQKKQDEQRQMIDSMKDGDNVVTLSGIHGTVHKVKDDIVTLQIAENTRIKIEKSYIGKIIRKEKAGGKESKDGKDNNKEEKSA